MIPSYFETIRIIYPTSVSSAINGDEISELQSVLRRTRLGPERPDPKAAYWMLDGPVYRRSSWGISV